eukprot:NODE_1106_length_2188_cov_0.215893.p1 type:complete len:260 gc:universal NODE_1106_length_2188_cov_0.215893:1994-1215(-)
MNFDSKCILTLYLSMISRILGVSQDCPTIISFLQGLNLHITTPLLYQSIPTDCCTTSISNNLGQLLIVCLGNGQNQHVVNLELSRLKLNGTIKSQFIPSSLTTLFISQTTLNTTIPSSLPNTIKYLNLNGNSLRGVIPNTLPTALVTMDVGSNQLTGLPTSFPATLTSLTLSYNSFTTMPVIPQGLIKFDASYNLIKDQLPNVFPTSITDFYASNNMIYGTIPAKISNTLQYFYISQNLLQGFLGSPIYSIYLIYHIIN